MTAALEVVKPGGRIVYSTCSISPQENDEVIRRLIKKKDGRVRVIKDFQSDFVGLEETEFGFQIFPDRAQGGPIYFSILEKTIKSL